MAIIYPYNRVMTSGFDTDTQAWLNQLTVQPSANYQNAINNLVIGLKACNVWNQLDRLWIFATEQQQHARVSLVNPTSSNITEVNTPTWVALSGYGFNGTSSYLNTNYAWATNGVKFTQNNCSLGVYILTNNFQAGYDGSLSNTIYTGMDFNAVGKYNPWLNDNGNGVFNIPNTLSLISARRNSSASGNVTAYQRGSALTKTTNESGTLGTNTYNTYIGCFNTNGTAATFNNHSYAMWFMGGGNINQQMLYNVFQAFAQIIGFAV